MAFNGSGLFLINTAGQPVVSGTLIQASVFNALTADLATGLSTCITKDGQTTITANIPMTGFKFTQLGLGTSSTDSARVDNANVLDMVEGRLTVLSGNPVPTTDQTGKETLYFTPYSGNRIALYDGTNWHMYTFSELSIDIPDVTAVHDVFCYDNAGTPALELLQWSTDTARATALTRQNGVLVKTGATTRRYLGTFYSTTAGNGQIEDAMANRFLWNYYNRVARLMRVDGGGTWNYTTATIRQANASSSNQLNYVLGVSEDTLRASLQVTAANTNTGVDLTVGIGLDSTTAISSLSPIVTTAIANGNVQLVADYAVIPAGVGKHYLSWLEYSAAVGTTTWKGQSGAAQSGIFGVIFG